jgi:hypothetical protein
VNGKKSGKKGPQKRSIDAMCRSKSLHQFRKRHQHCIATQQHMLMVCEAPVDMIEEKRLPHGGVEAKCCVCGAQQRFAEV